MLLSKSGVQRLSLCFRSLGSRFVRKCSQRDIVGVADKVSSRVKHMGLLGLCILVSKEAYQPD